MWPLCYAPQRSTVAVRRWRITQGLCAETEHVPGESEQLRDDSDQVTAVYGWLRERFNAMRAALGQESDDDR
jgi:hypothetical protein